MKKEIITLFLALATCLGAWAGNPARIERLVGEYKGHRGFEVVTMGRLGMNLMRNVAILSGDLDRDEREAMKSLQNINKIVAVDFEDAAYSSRSGFTAKLEEILKDMPLLMEMRDDGETVRIYGKEEGTYIRDFVLYDTDGELIYFEGLVQPGHIDGLKDWVL